jgi:hypothetical protein
MNYIYDADDNVTGVVHSDACNARIAALTVGAKKVVDVCLDGSATAGLEERWPNLGDRVVVIAAVPGVTLDGFSAADPELIDGTYLYIFDRFDPANGIGEANPHGSQLVPGYGWQE